jgi:hypothetical protein
MALFRFHLTEFINIPVFIASFAAGMFAVYITLFNELRTVYVFPTPDNVHLLQYKDSTGTCFKYNEKKVSCPAKEGDITKIPAQ